MATFKHMQDRVKAVIRDVDFNFVQLEDVKAWINEAYLDLSARLNLIRKSSSDTFAADGTDALPADFISLESISIGTETPDVTTDVVFLSWKIPGVEPPSTLVRIFDGKLETWPVQVSTAYVLEYYARPTALVEDTDVPVIPEELHVRLINYARAQAKWQMDEPSQADTYYSLYMEGLPPAPRGIKRERPASLSLIPAPAYFDADQE